MPRVKAEELCHVVDFMPLTFSWPEAAEPNWSLSLVPSLVFPGTEKRVLKETSMSVQGFLKENIAKYFNKTSGKDANHDRVHKDSLTWLNTIQGDN